MMQAVEASLKRLNTDYVDLFYLHAWDFTTPVDEVMRGLDDLVRSGKVLYVGISDTPAWVVSQANTLAELRGWSRFVGLQIRYSLIDRAAERDLLPMARSSIWRSRPGACSAPASCRASTSGAAPERRGRAARWEPTGARPGDRRASSRVAGEIGAHPGTGGHRLGAAAAGRTPPAHRRGDVQLPRQPGGLDVTLTDDQMKRLDEASAIELGFPHDFLALDSIRDLVYGGTFDVHRSPVGHEKTSHGSSRWSFLLGRPRNDPAGCAAPQPSVRRTKPACAGADARSLPSRLPARVRAPRPVRRRARRRTAPPRRPRRRRRRPRPRPPPAHRDADRDAAESALGGLHARADVSGQRHRHRADAAAGRATTSATCASYLSEGLKIYALLTVPNGDEAGDRLAGDRLQPRLHPARAVPHHRTLRRLRGRVRAQRLHRLPARLSRARQARKARPSGGYGSPGLHDRRAQRGRVDEALRGRRPEPHRHVGPLDGRPHHPARDGHDRRTSRPA